MRRFAMRSVDDIILWLCSLKHAEFEFIDDQLVGFEKFFVFYVNFGSKFSSLIGWVTRGASEIYLMAFAASPAANRV